MLQVHPHSSIGRVHSGPQALHCTVCEGGRGAMMKTPASPTPGTFGRDTRRHLECGPDASKGPHQQARPGGGGLQPRRTGSPAIHHQGGQGDSAHWSRPSPEIRPPAHAALDRGWWDNKVVAVVRFPLSSEKPG